MKNEQVESRIRSVLSELSKTFQDLPNLEVVKYTHDTSSYQTFDDESFEIKPNDKVTIRICVMTKKEKAGA